jgi:UDP-N-acetylmuramoyl-L-alanyl-D-glutamate--2,6-diaminopimelate ligase
MLYRGLLGNRFGDDAAWLFGTVYYRCGARTIDASHTTPEAADIFRMIGEAPARPLAVAMEVSSHSLDLDRVEGLRFDVAVWTNLTQDHLDYHKTMDAYYAAKKKLFTRYLAEGGCAAINIDDPWGERLAGELDGVNVVTYGMVEPSQVRIDSWSSNWDGSAFDLVIRGKRHRFSSRLTGRFNICNLASMAAGAVGMGMDADECQKAFDATTAIPGRMQRIDIAAPFAAVVDYAHTPDALDNVLRTARELTKGKLTCVFGAGGDRDRTKRPRMAAAAAHHCDMVIVTSDNPRSEEPRAIVNEVLKGMPLDLPHLAIVDRTEAIAEALRRGRTGDCVVIAGKGHETYQEIKGVRHHFDDAETVRSLWTDMQGNRKS